MFNISLEEFRMVGSRVAVYTAVAIATTALFNFTVQRVSKLIKRDTTA